MFPEEGASKDSGVVENGNFQRNFGRVVNNTIKKYCQYQYQYKFLKRIAIPIAILS